ncbi:FliH/SctL family protein [Yoonia sp. 208BN28-4]|uniref:FliH/SctL family protein n=1 Tax=Yoonia sp. 208BN28-4 TaxID=3126505 RepID=UPI0030B6E886
MLINLEDFDTRSPSPGHRSDPTNTPLYKDGFAAGEAAAKQEILNEQDLLKATLVQEIADMSFGFAEAQAHVTAQMTSLCETLMHRILPAVLTTSLRSQLLDLINAAIAQDAKAPMTICVPKDQLDAIKASLGDHAENFITFVGDPTMTSHAALVSGPHRETHLDLDLALVQISAVFDNLTTYQKRQSS